ncbi:MAG: M14 family zinc carboxypeptidase [Solirubrobacterales bacterium]
MSRSLVLLLSAAILATPALIALPDFEIAPNALLVPSPESVLGFRPGADRKLADWTEIAGYFRKLGASSPRVRVEEVGRTTEGRPFLVVTITSEANQARLEEIRRDNLRLYDPRGLPAEEAERILHRGKVIVSMNYAIHSVEVGGSLTPLLLAHRLAGSHEPEVLRILEETVLLLIPSHNPDGTDLVTAWQRKHVGTPYEGSSPPVLYQKYAGHDNNRDWYMFTQVETELTVRHVHDRFRPQIVHDVHQMARRGARMFVPPYLDPWEPNVDPALRAAVGALGSAVAARLVAEGRTGVVTQAIFDAWSPARAYPHTHGGVRILSETASADLASPVELRRDGLVPGLGYDPRAASWNFPAPWPGGTWRLADVVDYQLAASWAVLDHAARNREHWLRTFLGVNRRACDLRSPFAFVFPAEQEDPLALARLLRVLRTGGVEVERARAAFKAGGRSFGPGSHVVAMHQPASGFAKTVLERQRYPDRRQWDGGPPVRPYDVTAHTLPLLLGVAVETVEAPFPADLERTDEATVVAGHVEGTGAFFAFGHGNGELVALGRLLRAGVAVDWATKAFEAGGRTKPAGTLLVPLAARDHLEPLARELGFVAHGVPARPAALRLRRPRVGLYKSWVPSMDEGWTRFVFEKEAGVDYETLHDPDVKAGGLAERFDAIVVPDQPLASIKGGHAAGTMPEGYVGGLGAPGTEALKAFVHDGGTLVALNAASLFAAEALDLPLKNALAGVAANDFYCPGALLRVRVHQASPLAAGLPATSPIWFESSPAFDARAGAVLTFEDDDPLLSGWLLGGKMLKGAAALVEVPVGRGRVVLFGFRPQYRAQSWATYVPLLNAIYLSAATDPPPTADP